MRGEVSTKNKYYLTKHRFYELYHWCLQYKEWRQEFNSLSSGKMSAERKASLRKKIRIIEETAHENSEELWKYILKSVTDEDASYTYLQMRMNIPCGPDMFYDRRRRFFWLLDRKLSDNP